MKESAFARKKAAEGTEVVSNSPAPTNEFEVLAEGRSEVVESDSLSLRNGETLVETLSEDIVLVRLHAGESIVVLGVFDLTVKTGTVEVLGTRISSEKECKVHRVFAPRSHALPVITGLDGPEHGKRTANSIILNSVYDGIKSLDMVSNASYGLWDIKTSGSLEDDAESRPSFYILGHHFQYEKRHRKSLIPFQPNQQWLAAVEKASAQHAKTANSGTQILICGPKNSGKSTMARYIANSLLSPINNSTTSHGVAILDIDPGQPEFGPPGTLSLVHLYSPILGPSYTHSLKHAELNTKKDSIIHQHFLASITPKGFLGAYVEFLLHLLMKGKEIQKQFPNCPLIINASGWIAGDGMALLDIIFSTGQLTNVIYMSDMGPPEVISYLNAQCENRRINLSLVRTQTSTSSRSASTLRQLQYLSYFLLHTAPNTDEARLSEESSIRLQYAGSDQLVHGLTSFGRRLDEHQVADHFTDSLVGIIALDSFNAMSGQTTSSIRIGSRMVGSDSFIINTSRERLPYIVTDVNQPVLIDPWRSQCIGLGIITGLNRHNGTLDLQTPVTIERLGQIVHTDRKMIVLVAMESVSLEWMKENARFPRIPDGLKAPT